MLSGLLLGLAVYMTAPEKPEVRNASSTTTTTTQTTTSTTSSATTTSTTGEPAYEHSATSTSGTTTTQKEKRLSVDLSEGKFYKNDVVRIRVTLGVEPVGGAQVTIDGGNMQTTNQDGIVDILRIDDGNHTIKAAIEGYEEANVSISVNPLPYALSADVKTQRTPEERSRYIAEGKVVFRFYDTPNCVNCLRMKPWAAAIANANRNCVKYELLNLIHDGPREEIKAIFPDQSNVATPVVIIDGPRGHYRTAGFMPKGEMEDRVKSSTDGRCPIE